MNATETQKELPTPTSVSISVPVPVPVPPHPGAGASYDLSSAFDPKTLAHLAPPPRRDSGRIDLRALVFAAACALLSGMLFVLYLRRLEVETSGGAMVRVLMVVKPVAAGSPITDDALTVRSVPQAYVEARAIRETDRTRILGLKADFPLKSQQSLLWTDLSLPADDRHKLSEVLVPGMRAFALRAPGEDRAFALVRPGDRVDVVANVPHPTLENQRTATFVAQNVLVLAVGRDMGSGGPETDAARESVVTLSVTPQQVQLLSLVATSEHGKLSVALRSRAGGPEVVDSPEVTSANLLAESKPRAGGR